MVLLANTNVDQSARMPGGLLAKSLPAPAGWERGGIAIPYYGCGEPVLRDKCVTAEDVPNRNGDVAAFPAIPIEYGSACSTTGPDSVLPSAEDGYEATADWALSRQLQTDAVANGQVTLNDGTLLGTVADADFATAVGALEQAAADAGFGRVWVMHTTVRGASYLAQQGLMTIDGYTPAGARVIIGTGYQNPNGTTVELWVTGPVWASISEPTPVENVAYRQNNLEAWARGAGVAGFDPCINERVRVTVPAAPA